MHIFEGKFILSSVLKMVHDTKKKKLGTTALQDWIIPNFGIFFKIFLWYISKMYCGS